MDRRTFTSVKIVFLITACLMTCGCAGFLSNMIYMIKGFKVDAAYEGLQESRVAIVVVSEDSSYGSDTLSAVISRALSKQLAANVEDISIIPQNVIDNWKDTNGWDNTDYRALGKGVNADKVLAVEISAYSIHEGSTLYKGRCQLSTDVFDLTDGGKLAYTLGPAEYAFPRGHARPAISVSESQFEAVYLHKLVNNVARNFYAHEKGEPVAEDATGIDFY